MGYPIKQGSTTQVILFQLISSTDHLSGLTGKAASVTVTLSKNGGAPAAPAGAISEIANGWYALAAHATDNNTLGPLLIHAKDAASDPYQDVYPIVAYDPLTATNLGLSALPTASPGAANGVITYGTATGQSNPTGGKMPATLNATDVTGNLPASVNAVSSGVIATDVWGNAIPGAYGTGTAGNIVGNLVTNTAAAILATPAWKLTTNASGYVTATNGGSPAPVLSGTVGASTASTITLPAGSSTTTDFYKGMTLRTTSGSTAKNNRIITAYNSSTRVITLDWPLPFAPTNSSDTFEIYENSGAPALDSSLRPSIGGSVNVGSVNTGVIATDVWNGNASTYNNASSMGSLQNSITTILSATNKLTFDAFNRINANVYTLQNGVITNAAFASAAISSGVFAGGAITSSVLATGAITASTIAAGALAPDVWNATAVTYNNTGSMGNRLNSAGGAADPWATALPGSYAAGSAGNILGNLVTNSAAAILATPSIKIATITGGYVQTDMAQTVPGSPTAGTRGDAMRRSITNLDALISSRSTFAAGGNVNMNSATAGVIDGAVWGATATTYNAGGSMGQLQNRLDAAVSSRSTFAAGGSVNVASVNAGVVAADVWNAPTATYTAAGSFGLYVQSITGGTGGGTDPWATALPGTYPGGSAGYMLNQIFTRVDASVTSRQPSGPVSLAASAFAGITVDGYNFLDAYKEIMASCMGTISFDPTTLTATVSAAGNPAVTRMTAVTDAGRDTRTSVVLSLA